LSTIVGSISFGPTATARVAPAQRPIADRDLDAIYAQLAVELGESGHPLDAGQVRWVVEQAQRRTASLMGKACVVSGRIR
jgi:hypothetical protein